MKCSVVIPAHNRPALLREAVASVAAQTHADWEIVLVDDGSTPAIGVSEIGRICGPDRLVPIRHEVAQGVARAKNAGVRAAAGEIVTILDDDDLLLPNALEAVARGFTRRRELDCIFLGVEPFGAFAERAAERRRRAVNRLVHSAARREDELWLFDQRAFEALIQSVPIDLQRPAARRGAWNIVGGFDEVGLYSESAWTIRASALCRLALTVEPLTRWRLHGDNFGWPKGVDESAAILRQTRNTLASSAALAGQLRERFASAQSHLKLARASLAEGRFDLAYQLRGARTAEGFGALIRSALSRPRAKHLKLLLRYLLPGRPR